jgi:hypothetical protein
LRRVGVVVRWIGRSLFEPLVSLSLRHKVWECVSQCCRATAGQRHGDELEDQRGSKVYNTRAALIADTGGLLPGLGLVPETDLTEVIKRLPHNATVEQAAELTPVRFAAALRGQEQQVA